MASLTFIRQSEIFTSDAENISKPLRKRIVEDVSLGIQFLLSSQQTIVENNMLGAVPERFPVGVSNADKDSNVRIDYPQHSMSAVLAYEKIFILDKQMQEQIEGSSSRRSQNVHKLTSHQFHRPRSKMSESDSQIVAHGSQWANLFILGLSFVMGVVLVVNVFASPQQRYRRTILKNK